MSEITTFDLESMLIAPGLPSPPPTWACTYSPSDGVRVWPTHRIAEALERALDAGTVLGQNVSYDMRCMAAWHPHLRPKIWAAYEAGRVVDTMIAQRIIEIQRGDSRTDLGLSMLGRLWGVTVPDKTDDATKAIRMSFGQFYQAAELPPAHREYISGDVTAPAEIFAKQMATGLVSMRDLTHLTRQSFWCGLCGGWGFRTDPQRVLDFTARVDEHLDELHRIARAHGFLRADGSKDTKVLKCAVIRAYTGLQYTPAQLTKADEQRIVAAVKQAQDQFKHGLRLDNYPPDQRDLIESMYQLSKLPLSKSGKSIGTDKVVKEDAVEDEALQDLATWGQWQTTKDSVLPVLMRGAVEPVHSKFSIVNTTRTATSPQQQNLAKGHRPDPGDPMSRHRVWGVRETFAPRPGLAFVSTDAKGLENCALAQCIVWRTGRREYANKINSGRDPLSEVGAHIIGVSYEEFVKHRKTREDYDDARSGAKPAVYGMSGGMSRPETLQGYARRGYGLNLTLEQVTRIAEANRALMREDGRQAWLDSAEALRNQLGRYDVPLCPQLTDLVRRNVSRTDCCNNPFQFVGAYVMSLAAWDLCRRQYLTGECPANLMTFVHDDLSSETHPDDVAEVAAIQEDCIAKAGASVCPDVRWQGESRALSHFSKAAKASYDAAGKLIVTEVAL